MIFAVVADLHGHLEHWQRLKSRLLEGPRPDGLILCGDLGSPSTLERLHWPPGIPWAFCLGNCDQGHGEGLKDVALAHGGTAWGESGLWSLGAEGSVAFTHFPAVARRLALSGRHRAVFFGHTHKASAETLDGPGGPVLVANPGDVEGRYGRVSGLLWDSREGKHWWVDV